MAYFNRQFHISEIWAILFALWVPEYSNFLLLKNSHRNDFSKKISNLRMQEVKLTMSRSSF